MIGSTHLYAGSRSTNECEISKAELLISGGGQYRGEWRCKSVGGLALLRVVQSSVHAPIIVTEVYNQVGHSLRELGTGQTVHHQSQHYERCRRKRNRLKRIQASTSDQHMFAVAARQEMQLILAFSLVPGKARRHSSSKVRHEEDKP